MNIHVLIYIVLGFTEKRQALRPSAQRRAEIVACLSQC